MLLNIYWKFVLHVGKPCAKLYEHSDFKGWVEEVNEGWGRMPYRNDQISSVKVNRDCWLTAYDDYKRKHKMFTVDARIANWGRYGELRGLGSYNDKMSAYECECNVSKNNFGQRIQRTNFYVWYHFRICILVLLITVRLSTALTQWLTTFMPNG